MSLWDLYSVATRDRTCEDDDTTLANYGKVAYDLTKMYSEQLGFDYTFDSEKEVRQDSIKTQAMEVYDSAKATWPAVPRCPFRNWFDKIHAIKHAIKDEAKDDIHAIKHWWHHIIHKIHHKEHKIANHLSEMWQ